MDPKDPRDNKDNKCRLCNAEVGTLLHRVSYGGCPLLEETRKEYISPLDDAYMNTYNPPLLAERALLLNLDKPRYFDLDRQILDSPFKKVVPSEARSPGTPR